MKNKIPPIVLMFLFLLQPTSLLARGWSKEYLAAVSSVPIVFSDDGICSGALIDPKHILTAYHCISSMREIKIIWHDQVDQFDVATVAAVDPENDLAILRLNKQGNHNPLLILQDPEDVMVGAEVFTIGHPTSVTSFGKFPVDLANSHLISSGIISKVNNDELVYDFSVSPGNSGGPVLNSDGKIIGVVSRKRAGLLMGNIGYAPGHRLINELYEQVLEQKNKLGWIAARPLDLEFNLTYSIHDYLKDQGASSSERILLDISALFFDRGYLSYATTLFLDNYALSNWSLGYKFHFTFNNLSTLSLVPSLEYVTYTLQDTQYQYGIGGGLTARYSVLPISMKYSRFDIDGSPYNAYSIYLIGSF